LSYLTDIYDILYECFATASHYYRKPEEKRLLGRHRRRWEDNIRLNIRKIGWEDVDWINLTQDRDQWGGGLL
jgi:hypothetical protein